MTGEVSTMLGHSDASVTLRKYGHLDDKNMLRLGATIDRAGEAFA
jgi:integrase